jgi:maleylpyruvate isomerase
MSRRLCSRAPRTMSEWGLPEGITVTRNMLGAPTDNRGNGVARPGVGTHRTRRDGILAFMTGTHPLRAADVTPAHIEAETERVVATAEAIGDEALSGPSLCPGWTRGHVLTHLARNADALARVCAVATDGVDGTMYDSNDSRDAEIAAGAARPAAEQAADVRDSSARLTSKLQALRPADAEIRVRRTPDVAPRIRVGNVPFLRLRELVYHHVDLDAGFTFADAPADVVEMLLEDAAFRLTREDEPPAVTLSTDEGDQYVVGDGTTRVAGPRASVLLWLARERTDGVTFDGPVPALPFGG